MATLAQDIRPMIHGSILENEPMNKHTSYHIGGPADLFIRPSRLEDLQKLVSYLWKHGIPYFVLGGGTNLLVSDKGIREVVLQVSDSLHRIHVTENKVEAGAGAKLGALVKAAEEASLSGLECETAVPGTIGGAVAMNAGTKRGYVNQWASEIHFMHPDGNVEWIPVSEAGYGYRESRFQREPDLVILGLRAELQLGNKQEIHDCMERLFQRRKETQPIEPSAGSVFRNPPGDHAARLIQEAGGKGLRIGDAMISPMHGNFIVNLNKARAEDVKSLIEKARELVYQHFSITLIPEVKLIGEW